MGVNLVTKVRSFAISTETFTVNDHDVQDGRRDHPALQARLDVLCWAPDVRRRGTDDVMAH